jgi:hypothetical protein
LVVVCRTPATYTRKLFQMSPLPVYAPPAEPPYTCFVFVTTLIFLFVRGPMKFCQSVAVVKYTLMTPSW